MTIRPMTKPEMMYSYTQSQQIRSQTGNIGYLRADMDTNGKGFFSTWNGFRDDLKVEAFKDEFDAVINGLRFGEGPEFFLQDRTSLAKYCFSHPEAAINDREFGVRVTPSHMHNYTLNEKRCDHFAAPFLCIMRISAKSIEKRDGVWYNVLYVFVTTSWWP